MQAVDRVELTVLIDRLTSWDGNAREISELAVRFLRWSSRVRHTDRDWIRFRMLAPVVAAQLEAMGDADALVARRRLLRACG